MLRKFFFRKEERKSKNNTENNRFSCYQGNPPNFKNSLLITFSFNFFNYDNYRDCKQKYRAFVILKVCSSFPSNKT